MSKGKPRGRPFSKGNKKGEKIAIKSFLPAEINQIPIPEVEELEKAINGIEIGLHEKSVKNVVNSIDEIIENSSQELIDKIEFKKGENKLEIRFSKKSNRMYRIQIFLNDKIEVRPVTYTGTSTGNTFWQVLKGGLK